MQSSTTFSKSLALALPLVLVAAAGCHKKDESANAADAAAPVASDSTTVAATAPDETVDADAGTEIAAPDAVVAEDPNIPVNEAVTGTPPTVATYTADFAPPPQPAEEDQPARPEADDTWVPGYWWWSGPLHRYVWVGGAWRHPPPDQIWTPGRWTLVSGHYGWTPGYWGPRGYAREVIDVAPPALQVEVRPPAPAADYSWTPGYYAWRGGRYAWTAGVWVRPPRAGVTWVEPRYVNTAGHYYFQPGRWDYAPAARGVVYRPDINVRPGVRVKLEPVAPEVVVRHTTYVAVASRAISRGVRPDEHGRVILPRAVETEVVRPEERANIRVEAPRVRVDARPGAAVEVRPGAAVEVRPGVAAPNVRVEEHGGAAVEPRREERVEVRPGAAGARVEVRPTVTATQPPRGREPVRERRR